MSTLRRISDTACGLMPTQDVVMWSNSGWLTETLQINFSQGTFGFTAGKSAERFSFTAAADTLGQDNSSASYQKATDSILLQLVHDLTAVKATIG